MNLRRLKGLLFSVALTILALSLTIEVCAFKPQTSTAGSDEVPYKSYTYWVDYNTSEKTPVNCKPMYDAKLVVPALQLGADSNSKIRDVATDDSRNSYILDSGNSCVYILNSDYALTATLSHLKFENQELSFKDAQGIFIDKNNLIYIADTENARVLVADKTGNVQNILLLPDSNLIPTDFKYRPVKVAVDSKGYTYIACDGSFYGAILYSPQNEFLGFFGANTVKAGVANSLKKLWDRFTSNDIKRAADEISLPYTFNDIVVGKNDFVYTTTGKTGKDKTQKGQISLLNPGGKDILGKSDMNFADYDVGNYQLTQLIQSLNSIDVDENGFFYALDSTYGRIFWYDNECNIFSIFGGSAGVGEQMGTFMYASAIAVNGTDVIVSDSKKNTITVFKITEYGKLIRDSRIDTLNGDYDKAKIGWEKVISQDNNCQMAYRGLAESYLNSEEYRKAMVYAKKGTDRVTYAEAFQNVRTEILEKNLAFISLGVLIVLGLIFGFVYYKKKNNFILIKNQKFKTAFSTIPHPVEGFRIIKEKKQGSILLSVVLLAALYVSTVLVDTWGGFTFTIFDSAQYNAFYVLLSTVGLVILWTISNWLVCSLVSGIGELSEIFIVTAYCTIPITFGNIVKLILTHVLVPSEAAFLDVFMVICTLYAAFMLVIGLIKIHDFEFGKFIGTTIFSIIGMLIIVFLLFLIFMLAQQVFTWFKTLFIELRYR